MNRLKDNYHTHTSRCHHAEGNVADYARFAMDNGARILGMSDHVPWPDNLWPGVRMPFNELDDYVAEIEAARLAFPGLKILTAFECEYRKEYRAYLEDELLGRRGFHYLISGTHWVPVDGQWPYIDAVVANRELSHYSRHLVEAMESGLFAFVAHPDLFGAACNNWNADTIACSRDILSAAAALHMPLEINGYGLRKQQSKSGNEDLAQYPWLPFWELAAEYHVTVVCNSDAHRPQDVLANLPECWAIADRLGLQPADLSSLESPRRLV